ncbi:glycosyltransferase [Turicibacter sanguinis]|nr:glycosyltransferase [Turicibacter sanguinis]
MPKVSIIVPVYNVEKYLEKCLDSLVNQTLQDIEIIVVNDSTPDDSQIIIDRYVKQYPHLIKSYIKPNGGIADTRNFGISKVTGEYFGFVDSDDYVELTMFEKMYEEAIKKDADLVSCNFYWEYQDKLVQATDGPFKDNREYMTEMIATLWTKIYKTSWFNSLDIKFPSGLRYEDSSLLIRLAPHIRRFGFVGEPFVHYVQRTGSITHTHNHRVRDMLEVFSGIYDYFKQHNLIESYHEELEYLFIKYFLGSSFLRAAQIKDKTERKYVLSNGWKLLNETFPNWKKNHYLNKKKDKKHLYFRMMNSFSYWGFAKVFSVIKRG